MAATNPSDPDLTVEDSQIFRRSVPKSEPKHLPEEPMELLDFEEMLPVEQSADDDALSLFDEPLPESPSMIMRRGYRENSSVNLGGPVPRSTDSGSSIFGHAESLVPTSPGSGWFDSIPPAARLASTDLSAPSDTDMGKTHVIEDLFAGLDADGARPNKTDWQEQQVTNSITESEVIREYDRIPQLDDTPNFDEVQLSGSHIFPDSSDSDISFGDPREFDPSGVDLLNPERDPERLTGPLSSIFSATSSQESSRIELDALSLGSSDDATENMMFPAEDGGSSIFRKSSLHSIPNLQLPNDEGVVEFAASKPGDGEQLSGMVDWATQPLSSSVQSSMMSTYDEDADVDPFSDDVAIAGTSTTPTAKRGFVGTSGAGAVVAPPKRLDPIEVEDDEEPIAVPKRKGKRETTRVLPAKTSKSSGGLVGWLGGGALGLLFGAGAFAGLYLGDVLPSRTPIDASKQVSAPAMAMLEENRVQLGAATLAATKAEADRKNLNDQLAAARESAKATELQLKSALATVNKATINANKATAELKAQSENTELAKAETKVAQGLAEKATKELEAANLAALSADAKVVEAQKKLATAEMGLGLIIKELKANKLFDEKLDTPTALAQLPDMLKKLTTVSMTPDAKKAAEALQAAKKELDASQLALKSAEAARILADTEAKSAKLTADETVATAQKKADTEVSAAKKETEAIKKDIDAKVAVAVEKATVDAKRLVAEVEAEKLALIQRAKAESAAQQLAFSQQIAEVRQGGAVQITPVEVLTQDRAARDYNTGVIAYQARDFSKSLASLESAVKLDAVDARYWYYLGLTQWELGQTNESQVSFKKGSDLESRNKPNAALIGDALERIQGNARKELNRYR